MKPFTPTNWENLPSEKTPINAECLNAIEDCLVDLTQEYVANIESLPDAGFGTGVLYRIGDMCQLSMFFSMINPNEQIFTFPNNFKPATNFVAPLVTPDGATDGYIKYNRVDGSVKMIGVQGSAIDREVFVSYIAE